MLVSIFCTLSFKMPIHVPNGEFWERISPLKWEAETMRPQKAYPCEKHVKIGLPV